MKKTTIFFLLLFTIFTCKKGNDDLLKIGDFQFENVTDLPNQLKESSGLEIANETTFWSFNDSDGNAELYHFDTLGNLLKTLTINDVSNKDWEDITEDVDGNLYIGDFGNNKNQRQDLVIYKISEADLNQNPNSVSVEKIEFSYPEQTDFPPLETEKFYDAESLFSIGDFLYILTKDRSDPFIGKTILYRLPKEEGIYEAELLTEFFSDEDVVKGQITAADISPDGTTFCMISSETMYLFQNITGENIFGGDLLKLDFPVERDFEAVVFGDDCSLYLTNEKNSKSDGILFRISLCQ